MTDDPTAPTGQCLSVDVERSGTFLRRRDRVGHRRERLDLARRISADLEIAV